MSGWHREHPELVGTEADPWMIHDSYRKASALPDTPPPSPGQIAAWEEATAGQCTDEDCREIQPLGPDDEEGIECRQVLCHGRVERREP